MVTGGGGVVNCFDFLGNIDVFGFRDIDLLEGGFTKISNPVVFQENKRDVLNNLKIVLADVGEFRLNYY